MNKKQPPKNDGSSKADFKRLKALYATPLPSTRTGALYNAFSYPTKISPEAIALFIATHTKPGDTVLDTFGGSGTTGIAALLCDKPTKELQALARKLRLQPQWGPRHAVLYELGVIGAFVSKTMCAQPDPIAFETAARKLIANAEAASSDLYAAKDPDGKIGSIRHVIWSDVLVCPRCKKEALYADVVVKRKPLRFLEHFACPHCKTKTPLDGVKRATEKSFDPILKTTITQKKRRPALVYGTTDKKNWQRPANAHDLSLVKAINRRPIPRSVPNVEISWGELRRKGYHQGISHLHHFYTRRNLLALAKLWDGIDRFPEDIQDALRLLVLSYNATHSTLMTRVVAKRGQKDLVLTGAQSGVLYISSLPVEKNIFEGLKRKIKVFRDAFCLLQDSSSTVAVFNATSTKLALQDRSIDYVFTDPPFGDYIPYAELNQINEAWLGHVTNRADEIIISPSQQKNVHTYAELMGSVFSEISRVLNNDGNVTVVFHSAEAAVWQALTQAYEHAGLSVKASSILDKLQSSFKQVVSTVAVKGDPLLLLARDESTKKLNGDHPIHTEVIIKEILARAASELRGSKERTAERLYSRFISRCLEVGLSISVNADAFYGRVRALDGIQ